MTKTTQTKELELFAQQIRLETVRELGHLGFGHIGGSMSIADVLAVLYGKELRHDPKQPAWPERDWLILSKGHAGPALYATLGLRGYFPLEDLKTLNVPGTHFPSHCDRNLTTGIDMTTGSLGQGLSVALGAALAFRMDGRDNTVYAIIGDGECDEGQVWEAALFGAHQKLDNVITFLDYNKQQLDGFVKDILDLGDLAAKFSSFGWHTQEIEGDAVAPNEAAITAAKAAPGRPHMIVLHTKKGRGCSFAEDVVNNHSMNISQEMMDASIADIESRIAALKAEVSK